ncbi:MAG: hypothetical protein KIH67_003555 [Candidatus Moranbacteria bacterium]|nr:hypothetical protein [Candidatus Moranbacteria bacterium]
MPFVALPEKLLFRYRIAQVILYVTLFLLFSFLIFRSLFPIITHSFDFENPTSSKHDLLVPKDTHGSFVANGKLPNGESLIFHDGTSGLYQKAILGLKLEEKEPLPKELEITLRHGYAATWLPEGEPIKDFPAEKVYLSEDTYYMLRNNELSRFVSREAFLSRYPESYAEAVSPEFLNTFTKNDILIGYRPGLLVEYADGVFLIVNETDMRPIGSARIFANIGYRFEDVKKVSAEELGIYKRGKIFLSGDIHPNGTVFLDTDSQTYYIVQDDHFHKLLPGAYLDFLLTQSAPITFSQTTNDMTASCTPTKDTFSHSVSCEANLALIYDLVGSDYEMRISNNSEDTEFKYYEAQFYTAINRQNFEFILSQVKENFLARFGPYLQ